LNNEKIAAIIVGIMSIILFPIFIIGSANAAQIPKNTSNGTTITFDEGFSEKKITRITNIIDFLIETKRQEKIDEINRQNAIVLNENTEKINNVINELHNHVGKTWYVFSGSSPRGWDCSGLVRWTYSNIGIDLYHGATTQRNSGTIVAEPKVGDLVSFNYRGSRGAYHIGIYLSPDEMIHSGGKKGQRTEIISISEWAKDNNHSEVVYTRIIETN
jgi:cell wall-associated NlpC family hydrolase